MYQAEKFLLGVPLFQDNYLAILRKAKCIEPFDPVALKNFIVEGGAGSGEKILLEFALMLFDAKNNKVDIGRLMNTLGDKKDLDYVGKWVARGYKALD